MICRVERLVDYKINSKFEHSPPFLSRMVSLRPSTLSSLQNPIEGGGGRRREDLVDTERQNSASNSTDVPKIDQIRM